MKKTTILIIVVLFMVIGYAAYNTTINIYGNGKLAENLSDFKVYLSNLKVNGKEVSGLSKTKDNFTIENVDGKITVDIINDSTEYDAETYLECEKKNPNIGRSLNYDYTGGEQTFTVSTTGTYRLEVWGAQGGYAYDINRDTGNGGYGGYSSGEIYLEKGSLLYINVGGKGEDNCQTKSCAGGYNGGSSSTRWALSDGTGLYTGGGGGATHIATTSGTLDTLENKKNNILVVAGAGGGGDYYPDWKVFSSGGSGGGYAGNNAYSGLKQELTNTGGTQTSGAAFGKALTTYTSDSTGGSGGGYYGGISSNQHSTGAGGSGYIGNSLLSNKVMYCYYCTESKDYSTKTVSTTCRGSTAVENCAKRENGYARITLLSLTEDNIKETTTEEIILAQGSSQQSLQKIEASFITCKLKLAKVSRISKNNIAISKNWNFSFTGEDQNFIVPITGTYKLEVWGAQGGTDSATYHGGYGGYSTGLVKLTENERLYIYTGEKGKNINTGKKVGEVTAYPNGGSVKTLGIDEYYTTYSSGGGSTHISIINKKIQNLENNKNSILIVAGGGGGACTWWKIEDHGGSGGGYIGTTTSKNYTNGNTINFNPTAGSQSSGGSGGGNLNGNNASSWLNGKFGIGGGSKVTDTANISSGGGGGLYGGGASWGGSAAGGSGYIGNSLLSNKAMYCYNCQESKDISTKTISTTCTSATPKENCSKQGNGYARITLVNVS